MVGSKVNPFLAVIVVWREWTSYSPSTDSISTPRKTASENSYKNLSAIQRSDQKLCPFQLLFWSGANRHPLYQVAIPYLVQGKRPQKTPVKIWERSMVESKVTVIFSWYCGLPRTDLLFTYQQFHAYSKKIGIWKVCRNLSGIQQLYQKLRSFLVIILDRRDQTSPSPSNDSIPTRRKTAFENSCKNLSVIGWSNQKL